MDAVITLTVTNPDDPTETPIYQNSLEHFNPIGPWKGHDFEGYLEIANGHMDLTVPVSIHVTTDGDWDIETMTADS